MFKLSRLTLFGLVLLGCGIGAVVVLLSKAKESVRISITPPSCVEFLDAGELLVNSKPQDIQIPPEVWMQLRIVFENPIVVPDQAGVVELARLHFGSGRLSEDTITLLHYGQLPVGFRYRGCNYIRKWPGDRHEQSRVDESIALLYLLHSFCANCSSHYVERRKEYLMDLFGNDGRQE